MDNVLKENQIKLLQAVAKGDHKAFENLYQQTSPYLFAIALRMLRNHAWAEEVLHESFLAIWNRAEHYDPALSSPITWLTHIVRNRCIDGLRSRQGRQAEHDVEYDDQQHYSDDGKDKNEYAAEHAEKLDQCLHHLDSTQRQCISLAYYQGMSHAEIADWTGQPLGSVKSWIRRALDHLKSCVEL